MSKGKMLTLALAVAVSAVAATPENTPDRFVRYVQSSGYQAVNVDVIGKCGTKAEMKVEWMTANQGDAAFLDARGSGETRVFFAHSTSAKACAGYGSFVYIKNDGADVYWEADRIYTVTTEYAVTETNTVYATFNIDGTEMWKQTYASKIDTGKNLYLFGANINGTVNYRCKARCYGLKIWQDDANGDRQLVRDFTPCVKDGRAGLYDSVSETIFYSFTGTDLIYDEAENVPDEFVEYIEANGDTYIDTGIAGRSGTRCDADMMWLRLGGDYAFLNAHATDSSIDRIFLIHSFESKMDIGYGLFVNNNGGGRYAIGTRYSIQSDLRAGSQTLVVNGNTEYSGTNPDAYDSGCNLYLFANNVGGAAENRSHARLYGLTIWQDDANGVEHKVREFRPCLKGGVVALYDAVSETIFYPNGSPLRADTRLAAMPDAYLEYIESNGRSVIDTWVPARAGIRAQGEFMWSQLRTRRQEQYAYVEPSSKLEQTYLGGSDGSANRFYLIHESDKKLWYAYGNEYGYLKDNGANVTIASDQRYSFDVSYLVGSQTIDLNGRRILETTSAAAPDARCNLYLFGCNFSNMPYYESRMRCYGLKIWQDGTLVCDFKPCVKDGKAMLFDAVSRKLFRPSPDIAVANNVTILPLTGDEQPSNRVDYVESDRTFYIDTGVIGRAGTTAEFEMQWLSGPLNDMSFLGARKDENTTSRFFFWHHNTSGQLTYGYGNFMYLPTDSTTATTAYLDINRHMVEYDRTYHVRSSMNVGSQRIEADGALISEFANQSNIDTERNLYLFGCNLGGSPDYLSRIRLYWLKIWQDGALVRNFIPVRLDSGQVVLWDKVEKRGYVPIDKNGNPRMFSAIGPDGDIIRSWGTMFLIR